MSVGCCALFNGLGELTGWLYGPNEPVKWIISVEVKSGSAIHYWVVRSISHLHYTAHNSQRTVDIGKPSAGEVGMMKRIPKNAEETRQQLRRVGELVPPLSSGELPALTAWFSWNQKNTPGLQFFCKVHIGS